MNLCHNPELACEVTLQPVDILGVDAAILFSDILVVPNEMGMKLDFVAGEGPVFENPIRNQAQLDALIGGEEAASKLEYVMRLLDRLNKNCQKKKHLLVSLALHGRLLLI